MNFNVGLIVIIPLPFDLANHQMSANSSALVLT
jgi:hypothetical protein